MSAIGINEHLFYVYTYSPSVCVMTSESHSVYRKIYNSLTRSGTRFIALSSLFEPLLNFSHRGHLLHTCQKKRHAFWTVTIMALYFNAFMSKYTRKCSNGQRNTKTYTQLSCKTLT